jgi:hypothetical protein
MEANNGFLRDYRFCGGRLQGNSGGDEDRDGFILIYRFARSDKRICPFSGNEKKTPPGENEIAPLADEVP